MDMNVLLRERNGDTLGIQLQLDALVRIKQHAPVITRINPTTQVDVDRAIRQGNHHCFRRGVLVNTVISHKKRLGHRQCLFDIIFIGDANDDIDPARE